MLDDHTCNLHGYAYAYNNCVNHSTISAEVREGFLSSSVVVENQEITPREAQRHMFMPFTAILRSRHSLIYPKSEKLWCWLCSVNAAY